MFNAWIASLIKIYTQTEQQCEGSVLTTYHLKDGDTKLRFSVPMKEPSAALCYHVQLVKASCGFGGYTVSVTSIVGHAIV